MDAYFFMKNISLSEGREFGLDTSAVTIEKIPLILTPPRDLKLKRIDDEDALQVGLVRRGEVKVWAYGGIKYCYTFLPIAES